MVYDIALRQMDTCLDKQRNLSIILTVSYRLGVPGQGDKNHCGQ